MIHLWVVVGSRRSRHRHPAQQAGNGHVSDDTMREVCYMWVLAPSEDGMTHNRMNIRSKTEKGGKDTMKALFAHI
jgi:hypothetical protein